MTAAFTADVHRPFRCKAALAGVAAGMLLAACGSNSSDAGGSANHGAAPNLAYPTGSVVGRVAAINPDGITVSVSGVSKNVVFAPTTTFSRVREATAGTVAVGDCIDVTSAHGAAGRLTASSITETAATSCPTAPSTPPASSPPPGTQPGGGVMSPGVAAGPPGTPFSVVGTVTSVANSTVTIHPVVPAGASTATVTTTPSTAYFVRSSASRTDIAVGDCLAAFGTQPGVNLDAGAVTISDPVRGGCPAHAAPPERLAGAHSISPASPSGDGS